MITNTSFTEMWINTLKKANSQANINPPLFEKMIYALLLAELLKVNGLDFIFKGGTSLILLLDKPQRFSIDIDIVTQAPQQTIEAVLEKVCTDSRFTHFELDKKRSYHEGVPKAHYKLYFSPIFNQDNKILLDILFDENPYPQTQDVDITQNWIETHPPLTKVTVPTIESITGDKLTAFAPNTVGIRYGQGKQSEIIKQMFDLGQLFNKIKDFEVVTTSFIKNAEKELSYRAELVGKSTDDVMDDILETCFDVVMEKQPELQQGLKIFGSWTIYPFRRNEAIETAGKIAYMISKIKKKDNSSLLHCDSSTMKSSDFLIQEPQYNFLNKKVKHANDALFYWYQTVQNLL
jgi:Nucleotidyl transferase AbiEii toxin, Type IV TA system